MGSWKSNASVESHPVSATLHQAVDCRTRGVTRFEVGRDGMTAYEIPKGKSAKVQGMTFAEGSLWKRRRAGGPLGKLTCMWEDGVYLGVTATTGEIIAGNGGGVWFTRTVRRKLEGTKQLEQYRGRSSAQARGRFPGRSRDGC